MNMNAASSSLIHSMAHNYRLCLADFPSHLRPAHLDVPARKRAILFAGLSILHTIIRDIYDHFAHLTSTEGHWSDREYCYRAIEAPVKLLWALGAVGKLIQKPGRLELQVSRENLDQALKRCSVKEPAAAFGVLETVGFN